MGKKKFIDKKKAATFQLVARDSSDPNYDDSPGGDRVFCRVDNSGYSGDALLEDGRYGDADEDEEYDPEFGNWAAPPAAQPLSDQTRREILELGFPDDGYNYLLHMREIKNTGGGSAYYSNPKAKFEQLPSDVKAYDASKLLISENMAPDEKAIYSVASKTVNVRVQKAVDPEVAALLDDSDASRFGSDVEDLEEDFVVRANIPDGEEEEEGVCVDYKPNIVEQSENNNVGNMGNEVHEVRTNGFDGERGDYVVDKPRARRPLDDQFDIEFAKYDDDSDDEDEDEGNHFYASEEDESIEDKLKHINLNECVKDDFELTNYEVPGDDVEIQKTKELGKKYENEEDQDEVEIVEESSDESEKWDAETVITTYSNLENHPKKIEAPDTRKKKLSTVFEGLNASNNLIRLGGRHKLPVDFLPHSKEPVKEKAKDVGGLKAEQLKRKQHGQESKEEKKERKAAVKEEKRGARRAKKETKELYKGEALYAQRIAAISGPSSKRLM